MRFVRWLSVNFLEERAKTGDAKNLDRWRGLSIDVLPTLMFHHRRIHLIQMDGEPVGDPFRQRRMAVLISSVFAIFHYLI